MYTGPAPVPLYPFGTFSRGGAARRQQACARAWARADVIAPRVGLGDAGAGGSVTGVSSENERSFVTSFQRRCHVLFVF